jgi:ABC-type sugar transport system ATPase subunit
MSSTGPPTLLLSMRGIDKRFPGVHALRGVELTLERGQVLALLGENGAGKSTLIKILAGVHQPDAGSMFIGGQEARFKTPHQAQRAGIAVIHQELNLIPALTATENIFLGQEGGRLGFLSQRSERRAAAELLTRLGLSVALDTPCRLLTVAQQQIVEIAKALLHEAKIIVMDEPTASLTPVETAQLFRIIAELRARGLGVIYISHRLEEIFQIADRITVLRDGANVGECARSEIDRGGLIEMMVGRKLTEEFPPRTPQLGEVRLEVKGLARGRAVRDVSLNVRRGEVLALTGLVGAGRTETARLIFGADKRDSGYIFLDGRELKVRQPRDAITHGIALLPEDRKTQGLVLMHSLRDNFGLPNMSWLARLGFVRGQLEKQRFGEYVQRLRIRTPSQTQLARNLSGGNQQKIVLAKWLARDCEVLIFDEPTRGIDVGARYEIYQLINQLAAEGKAVIMISSDLPEVLGMADRILVMHEGRITGEIPDARQASQAQIMALAVQ